VRRLLLTLGFLLLVFVGFAESADQTPGVWNGLVVAEPHRCEPLRLSDYLIGADGVPAVGKRIVSIAEAHDAGLCSRSWLTKGTFAKDERNIAKPNATMCDVVLARYVIMRAYELTVSESQAIAMTLVINADENGCQR